MIEILRSGRNVVVRLKGRYPVHDHDFDAFFNAADSEWAALLLQEHLRSRMLSELHDIRERAYERGWKDAKAHKTKATWFSSLWKD